ncbi:VWA domain-containing protein [Granulosicoccus sp. 3-233]|uniref:VWA domain-containing protein n=1 Tax=Granulosicoccus sp. 3-233 TaxID=3417969 RepID=UPI003D3476B6
MNSTTLSRFGNSLSLLASLLLLIALFMPPINRNVPVNRYLLVFDISQSMNVEDVVLQGRSTSRLEAALQAATALLQSLPCGSEIGLAIFAATRTVTLMTPLEVCAHYNGLLTSLGAIDGRMRFKNASSVGKGVHQSLRAASTIGNHTAIALFTDGHEAPPLRHGQTGMPKSEGHEVKGFLVGVGGDQAVRIPKVDNNGRHQGYWQADEVTQLPIEERNGRPGEELSALHEPHLRQLSQLSGLEYIRLNDIDTLVGRLSDNGFASKQHTPVNMSWLPAALALLLLILRFLTFPALRRR